MTTGVAKKTFSIKKTIATQLDKYNNKSKFVNEALSFYIDFLDSYEKHKKEFLEQKIKQAMEGEFYTLDLSKEKIKNDVNYIEHSKNLENELLKAINDK